MVPNNPEEMNDDPILAVKFAEEHNLGPNQTIVDIFTPDEKLKLMQMIRKGEFNPIESAVLKYLMSEAGTLEDVGVMIGAQSGRSKGEPVSKPAALKEVNRILKVVAKRSKAAFGREINLNAIPKYKQEQRRIQRERVQKAAQMKAEQREQKKRAIEAEREFYKLLRELRKTQAEHGLPRSQYYIRHKAPSDLDISKMRKFGGSPDEM